MTDTATEISTPVRFDTKVAVLLHEDLLPWPELNVTAFLMSGIATSEDGLVGEPYADADGTEYLPMLRQPVMVMQASSEVLAAAREKALSRGITPAVFSRDLSATGDDEANRAAVAAVAAADLDLVGLALRAPKNGVDKVVKGASLHL